MCKLERALGEQQLDLRQYPDLINLKSAKNPQTRCLRELAQKWIQTV